MEQALYYCYLLFLTKQKMLILSIYKSLQVLCNRLHQHPNLQESKLD